jgi:4-oxalocrotonate tautomerase
MPMVTVKLIEGVFTAEQKQEMIRKITDTMVEIEGENLWPVTWVLVEEAHSGDWGIAGQRPHHWPMCTPCRRSRLGPPRAEPRSRHPPTSERPVPLTRQSSALYRHWPFRYCFCPKATPELALWPGATRKPGPRGQGPGSGTRLLVRGREPGF